MLKNRKKEKKNYYKKDKNKLIIHAMILTKIRKFLSLDYLDYSNYKQTCFEQWCYHYACKKRLCKRQLVKNKPLYNWYLLQWNYLVEVLFYQDHKEYIESSISDAKVYRDLFQEYPETIKRIFPGILLKMIQKQSYKTKSHEIN